MTNITFAVWSLCLFRRQEAFSSLPFWNEWNNLSLLLPMKRMPQLRDLSPSPQLAYGRGMRGCRRVFPYLWWGVSVLHPGSSLWQEVLIQGYTANQLFRSGDMHLGSEMEGRIVFVLQMKKIWLSVFFLNHGQEDIFRVTKLAVIFWSPYQQYVCTSSPCTWIEIPVWKWVAQSKIEGLYFIENQTGM